MNKYQSKEAKLPTNNLSISRIPTIVANRLCCGASDTNVHVAFVDAFWSRRAALKADCILGMDVDWRGDLHN